MDNVHIFWTIGFAQIVFFKVFANAKTFRKVISLILIDPSIISQVVKKFRSD